MNIIPNYIDPGTGSLLISLLISFVLSIIFSVRNLFYKIILFFSGKKYKGSNDFENKLVFFNEGKNYWNVFKPVLDELITNKQKFIYHKKSHGYKNFHFKQYLIFKHYS